MNEVIRQLMKTRNAASIFFDKSGKKNRSDDGAEWSLVSAANFLIERNGVIDWAGKERCDFGYETIWEYCAGEYFGKGRKSKEKAEQANENAHIFRNGFNRLKERMLEEWETPLYVIPRNIGQRDIEIITLDAGYVVNAQGQLALEVAMQRDNKQIGNKLKACYSRTAIMYGAENAKAQITASVHQIMASPLPLRRGNPLQPTLEYQA